MPGSSWTNTAADRQIKEKENAWISKCYQMLIASDILLEGAAGILVPVFECPVDLSRSPGSVSEGSPRENQFR